MGKVGFHGPSDDKRRVEIGYGIAPLQGRQGYAREAIAGLTDWAFATGEAPVCVASVSPRNAGSLALVRSLDFRQVGEQIDGSWTDSSSCSSGCCRCAGVAACVHSRAFADRRPDRYADETFSMGLSGRGGCRR